MFLSGAREQGILGTLVCPFFVECFRILQRHCAHETSLNVYVLLALSLMLSTVLSYQEMLCMYEVYELHWCVLI